MLAVGMLISGKPQDLKKVAHDCIMGLDEESKEEERNGSCNKCKDRITVASLVDILIY